ncbi:DUF2062 domain-containing protein [Erythrobacter litoralis]|uniref:DUF2062 domain-containing protein n=1 Tax=Erythrobacter litoralis TaxID=39960 RepID=UPI002435909C|nr:DUF2062 domain-containing protein [Erythrobacter litoralis]MDG6079629.1 DUF2062 domain-containing protein [Erythrobacter litoralis]
MKRKRSKDWLARRFERHMPTREEMAQNRFLKPIAHRFLSPELWRFTRRSVPRGVALGLFAAFIVPLGQIFLAAFLALPARANVPLAAIVTFVTNPFTLPFWLVFANRTGAFVLNIDRAVGGGAGHLANDQGALAQWLELGGVTAFGFLVLALVSAAIGYVVAGFVWQRLVFSKRRRKLREIERRLDRRLTKDAK